ncbi:Zn(2)-C6 fungal-type domain-containing protein [Fusarium sp. Ph1]|nr:Zn(2)-C6 fungal-type domain-containing protein [Fusarium sp. Ph1]
MLTPVADKAKPKRTRTNVKQSKFGCFTCKSRRIKCDELKPTCRRCLTSRRPCAYPYGAPPAPATTCLAPNLCLPQNRFVNLICRVLVQGPRRSKNDLEVAFWSHTIPQLTQSIPSVQAAAAAFGASYDAHVLRGNQSSEAIEHYTRALHLVQIDLASLRHGIVPCIVACLFLSCAEALQQRLDKGLLHLQGAFALLRSDPKLTEKAIMNMEQVSLLLRKLDLHSATFAVGRAPDLPPLPIPTPGALLSCAPDQALFRILHPCYHFIANASRYRYVSRRILLPGLLIEQGRHLADLKQWLSRHKDIEATLGNEQLLVLRAQCLAAFVHVANALEPHESAFDDYAPEFQEIVTSVETLFHHTDGGDALDGDKGLPFFTPEMGIIHPLYFTALKYRHPTWRRRAITLLKKSGREGPWVGEIEAAVASTVIEREEQSTKSDEKVLAKPRQVSESSRINACWVVEYMGDVGDYSSGAKTRITKVKAILIRCYDIDEMLWGSGEGPNEYPWRDRTHWAGWEETISVSLIEELEL